MSEIKNADDIWGISHNIVEKNKEVKHDNINDMPDVDKTADNISGYVINAIGNVVANFGFFTEATETEDNKIKIKISVDGFLNKLYNEDTTIIIGYGHTLGFTGLIDPERSQTLVIGPDIANGEDIVIVVDNDDILQTQKLLIIIREQDVIIDNLNDDIKNDFIQSIEDASEVMTDMNELEQSHNNYMKHIYALMQPIPQVEEEEYYE